MNLQELDPDSESPAAALAWRRNSQGWHRAKREQNTFAQAFRAPRLPGAKKIKKTQSSVEGEAGWCGVLFFYSAAGYPEGEKTFLLAGTNSQELPFPMVG